MTQRTYIGGAALDQVAAAEAELYRHLTTRPDGRCTACGQLEPCDARYRAQAVFLHYGVLPKRRPGAAGIQREVR